MKNNSNSTPDQVFSYIEHMLIEMRMMSEKENAPVLAYLIEMAIIEAGDRTKAPQNRATPVNARNFDAKMVLSS